jgi:hypothetical protein
MNSTHFIGSWDSSVGIVIYYGLDGWHSILGSGKKFLYSAVFILTLGPTQPPIHQVLGALSPGVKQLGHEAHH